ncbi:MAG: hypothetical protein KBE91_09520 [Bacteroidia bacterium]|nr:hypothetical protein [Bacteroidia bacterium]MBP9689837.1 hypothetical protein [Bacteroidia bacterium]
MNRTWAILLSVIFHPVFVNLLSFVLIIELNPYLQAGLSTDAKWFYIMYVFISTGLIPLFVVVARKALGYTSSVMLEEADDRHIPYIVTAIAYLLGYYLFIRIGAPQVMRAYMIASAAILIVVMVINFKTKISAHATSLGALCGLIIATSGAMMFDARFLLVAVLIFSGLTAVSRLALNAHSPKQIYAGFALGCIIMLGLM